MVHKLDLEVFSKSLPKIACLYNLGLSATPKRKDGLSKVFEWYLGDMVYQVKKRESEKVNVEDIVQLRKSGSEIRELIRQGEFPKYLYNEIS